MIIQKNNMNIKTINSSFLIIIITLLMSIQVHLKTDDLPIGSYTKFLTLQQGIDILENNIARLDLHEKNETLTDSQKKLYSHSILTLKSLKEEKNKHSSHEFSLEDSKEFVDKLEAKIRLHSHPDDLPFVIQKIDVAKIKLASTDVPLTIQELDLPLIYYSGLFTIL